MGVNCFIIKSNFISIGVEIDEELQFFDVNIIDNIHEFGLCVVDPDGDTHTKVGNDAYDLLYKITFEDKDIEIFLSKNNDYYEIEVAIN